MSILIQGIDMPKRHHINGYYIDDDGRVLDISRRNVVGKALQYKEPERKTGKWIKQYDEEDYPLGCKCSECEKTYVMPGGWANFCPNCGADMRGD